MKNKIFFVISFLGLGISACMSVQNQAVTENIQKGESPFVEAWIEYSGPSAKWGGPSSWVIQVDARALNAVHVKMSPEFTVYTAETRQLAANKVEKKNPMPDGVQMRDWLKNFAQELRETPDPMFRGCLYPVKVRLVKEDGGITERAGCRGTEGFAKLVSEATSKFVALAEGT